MSRILSLRLIHAMTFNQAIISPGSNHVRNLGVTFDRSLDFEPHVGQLVPKCTEMLLAINHVKHRWRIVKTSMGVGREDRHHRDGGARC